MTFKESRVSWLLTIALLWLGWPSFADELPNSAPLVETGDLADLMMTGLHRFAERKFAQTNEQRAALWKASLKTPEDHQAFRATARLSLAHGLGVDPRWLEPNAADPRYTDLNPHRIRHFERFGGLSDGGLVWETAKFRVWQVRWPVLEGVHGEGLLVEPRGVAKAAVIALPDAGQTPEGILGLGNLSNVMTWALRLAEADVLVLVPALIDRDDEWSGNPRVAFTNQPHREWIYRQAYHMGRHVIGYEVEKMLAAIQCLKAHGSATLPVAIAGNGEGGLIALCTAALNGPPEPALAACLVSGYFGPHPEPWNEPLYRNVFGWSLKFGDAELAALVECPLLIERGLVPNFSGPPAVRPGRRGGAAHGAITQADFASVEAEFKKIALLFPAKSKSAQFIHVPDPKRVALPMFNALERFGETLKFTVAQNPSSESVSDAVKTQLQASSAARQKRQVRELEQHVQQLVHDSDFVRDQTFLSKVAPEPKSLKTFTENAKPQRERLWRELFGKLDDPMLPANPRTRKIYDREKWVGYDVQLDVFPDVFAWGVLLLPKDLKPGEKRPVVVCQHGRNGVPKDTIEGDVPAYHDFAAKLCEKGFIVFAPHNPYRGEDKYRDLNRKANQFGCTLFSFILAQHEQILNWLQSLPQVDPDRIAFYGLSYGGETAVRVPPLLERYCLSICSADFNDWARKITATDAKYSFMFTVEWEMPYFNLGSTFNYFEMSALMLPRPFMVERGHTDGVAPDEWVASEYAKVRRLYVQMGLADKTEIEFFNGPHTINGQGTFRFLEKHLNWPPR